MPTGTVQKIEGDYAIVTIERQDMCGECHACEVIGEIKKCQIKCINTCQAMIDEEVEVDLSNQSFLKATLLMYGVPLAGLLVGICLGALLPGEEGHFVKEFGMIIGGLGLMTISFLWIRHRDKQNHYTELLPKIKRIKA